MGTASSATDSCSHAAAFAAEASTDCSSTNAAIGKLTTFKSIAVITGTDSAAGMRPFGVLVQTTVRSAELALLASTELGLRYLSRALSTSASVCVGGRLPAVE